MWVLTVLLIAGVGIFIGENLGIVQVQFLGWDVDLPRYQVALGLVASGFVAALLLLSALRLRRSRRSTYWARTQVHQKEGGRESSQRFRPKETEKE